MAGIRSLSNEELLGLRSPTSAQASGIQTLSDEELIGMRQVQVPQPGALDRFGVAEPALTLATGAIAEPIAGLAGAAVAPFAGAEAGTRAIEATREALTFQPRTQTGQELLGGLGEALQPVGEAISGAETFLGDTVFKATDSPTLAAAAASLPTAILETIGLKGAGKIAKSTKAVEPSKKAVRQSLTQAAPAAEDLKNISRSIYTELDDAGVRLKKGAYKNAVDNIKNVTKKNGLSKRTTPLASGLIKDLEDVVGTSPNLTEIDDLRAVAQGVAKSIERREAALGGIVVDEIDSFLDTLTDKSIISGTIDPTQIQPKFRAARNLWGRARKSETIGEAIVKAGDTASGFENGLRIEFNKILKNKNINRFFNDGELDAMRDLVRGDRAQNFAKLIGRFGFGEGRATNIVGGFLGSLAGTAAGGVPGSIAAVSVGTASRRIAQKLTKNKADFINTVTRAGSDGEDIAKAYLNTVPKGKRNITDLSELLSDPSIDLTDLVGSSNKLIKEATEIAAGRQAIGEAAGLAAVSSAQAQRGNQ